MLKFIYTVELPKTTWVAIYAENSTEAKEMLRHANIRKAQLLNTTDTNETRKRIEGFGGPPDVS